MNKQEFFEELRKGLSGLPQGDIEERLSFYEEMIDDRIEEGLSEEDAVLAVGSVDEIIAQIIADIPLSKIAKEKFKPKGRLKAWEILLLALGSPIWLSFGIAAVAVFLAVYISLWSVIISLWAVFLALAASALGGIVSGLFFAIDGNISSGIAIFGVGLICVGLSIFMLYGCQAATKGILLLTKKIAMWIKNCFIKKEKSQ